MPALRELQFAFSDALIHGASPELLANLRARGLPNAARFSVYRNNLYISLTEALRAVYPVVERLVGEDFFWHAATHYVRRQPSTSGNLQDYGRNFAEFLARFPATQALAYLPDVARLEWAWHEVFHAPADNVPAGLRGLTEIGEEDQPRLGFALNNAARLLHSSYPVLRIWQANQPGHDGCASLTEGDSRVLVLQRELQVDLYPLEPGEYALLLALAQSETLNTAYELAAARDPRLDLEALLAKHMRLGSLARWRLLDAPAASVEFADLTDDLTEFDRANVH